MKASPTSGYRVADLLPDEEEAPSPVIFPDFKPGIFFGMPEAEYHAIPALSSTGINWLGVSVEDFWGNTPWINPDAAQDETEFTRLGKAHHDRIVEGRAAFYARNCAAPELADYPDALDGMDDLKGLLRSMGAKVGGGKNELLARLRELNPEVKLWADIKAAHEAANEGKVFFSQDEITRIEIAAAYIERHPEHRTQFSGGMPEVSIFWRDAETGVPLKARPDYLKVREVVDLKSFSNPQKKDIDLLVYNQIEYRKYFVQAAHYLDGVAQIPALLEAGAVFGEHDAQWLAQVAAHDKHWVFVFQQTGRIPLVRSRRLLRRKVMAIGNEVCRMAIVKFKTYFEAYGFDRWIDMGGLEDLDDDGFSANIGR